MVPAHPSGVKQIALLLAAIIASPLLMPSAHAFRNGGGRIGHNGALHNPYTGQMISRPRPPVRPRPRNPYGIRFGAVAGDQPVVHPVTPGSSDDIVRDGVRSPLDDDGRSRKAGVTRGKVLAAAAVAAVVGVGLLTVGGAVLPAIIGGVAYGGFAPVAPAAVSILGWIGVGLSALLGLKALSVPSAGAEASAPDGSMRSPVAGGQPSPSTLSPHTANDEIR